MFMFIFTLLLNVVTATLSSGFQATVTAAGVNKISSFVVPLIDDLVKNKTITLPNIHIDTHVAEPIGHITIDLTNIQVSGLSLAALPVNVVPPSSFLLALDDLNLILNMGYKWRKVHWPHASDHGTTFASRECLYPMTLLGLCAPYFVQEISFYFVPVQLR